MSISFISWIKLKQDLTRNFELSYMRSPLIAVTCAILAVSALKTLKELSQKPQARMKRLSTVTTKHECRMRTRWLKLSPR